MAKLSGNFVAIIVLAASLFGAGCATTPDTGSTDNGAKRGGIESNAVLWLEPRAILEDVLHPPGACNQHFILTDRSLAWHVDYPLEGYAYAGFVLRSTNNLAASREKGRLRLRFRPGYEAGRYRAALLDANKTLISLPLVRKAESVESGWLEIDLPLSAFPERGLAVQESGLQTGVIFDWSSVREFRLIGNGRRSTRHVEVGLLRIVEE